MTGAPGYPKLLFVVEQAGRVEVLRGGHARAAAVPRHRAAWSATTAASAACSRSPSRPTTAQSGRFYVYYTDSEGNIRIDEFQRRSATRAARGSRRPVIEIPHPVNANHNGGQLQFLGDLLYFGTGDGGSGGDPPNNAQNKQTSCSASCCASTRAPSGGRPYSIPADNPFVGRPGRDEIYSYGLRNPFRFSFDTVTCRTAANRDRRRRPEPLRGARLHDRRRAPRGANFGWDAFEGFAPLHAKTTAARPIPAARRSRSSPTRHSRAAAAARSSAATWSATASLRACTGATSTPTLRGKLRSLVPHLRRAGGDRKLGLTVASPTSFGEDERGRLYASSQEGPVYRLVSR